MVKARSDKARVSISDLTRVGGTPAVIKSSDVTVTPAVIDKAGRAYVTIQADTSTCPLASTRVELVAGTVRQAGPRPLLRQPRPNLRGIEEVRAGDVGRGTARASAEDRLTQLIDRLLASMDAAASIGAWDRVVELAEDVLAVDPRNQRAACHARTGRRSSAPCPVASAPSSAWSSPTWCSRPTWPRWPSPRSFRTSSPSTAGWRPRPSRSWAAACSSSRATASWRASGTPPRTRTTHDGPFWLRSGSSSGWRTQPSSCSRRHGIEPAIRVGVHSGTVVIAGTSSGVIDGSSLSGSVPNVTARLQGEAEPGTVVISDTTRQLIEPHFELKPMGTRSLRGIARPMELHQVMRSNLAIPHPGHGLPESVVLVGRESQSRLSPLHLGAPRPPGRGGRADGRCIGGGRARRGRHREVGAGRRAGGARARRRGCRARGQLFALSRQRRPLADRAHARAGARVLPGPAPRGAAR